MHLMHLGLQEDLYEEDMPKKVKATGMISQLFRNTENFETLLSHETLLQVGPWQLCRQLCTRASHANVTGAQGVLLWIELFTRHINRARCLMQVCYIPVCDWLF